METDIQEERRNFGVFFLFFVQMHIYLKIARKALERQPKRVPAHTTSTVYSCMMIDFYLTSLPKLDRSSKRKKFKTVLVY